MRREELTGRLYEARRGGVKLELDRTRRLLAHLGDPQRRLACVQIGGTNGKGSTAAFVEAMCRQAGLTVGLFTSPHLTRLNERFRIGGCDLEDELLGRAGEAVEAAVEVMGADDEPTFFERVTALALVAFADAGVELAVLEVGLGGRYDATSAVDRRVVAITGVALDHQLYLGDTLEAVAAEKAGAIASGQQVVIGCSGEPEAVPMLIAAAGAAGAAMVRIATRCDVEAVSAGIPDLALSGAHQYANAACALLVMDALEDCGLVRATADVRRRGLAAARLPGRFEVVPGTPEIILDGAHNPHAAAALANALGGKRAHFILGWSSDKDGAGMARVLAPVARTVIATRTGSERAAPAGEVAAAMRAAAPALRVDEAADVAAALALARARATPGDPVVVCGSLFLVGEARVVLGLATADAVALQDPV
jgi:dihydrofolate synthase/folylpolyglutamate synthase